MHFFIRGERPVKDLKYDILKHPNVAFDYWWQRRNLIFMEKQIKQTASIIVLDEDIEENEIDTFWKRTITIENYELLSEEELEEFIREVS